MVVWRLAESFNTTLLVSRWTSRYLWADNYRFDVNEMYFISSSPSHLSLWRWCKVDHADFLHFTWCARPPFPSFILAFNLSSLSPHLRRLIIYCRVQRFRSLLVARTITSRVFSGRTWFRRASVKSVKLTMELMCWVDCRGRWGTSLESRRW